MRLNKKEKRFIKKGSRFIIFNININQNFKEMQTKTQKSATQTPEVAQNPKDAVAIPPSALEKLKKDLDNAITLLQANSPDVALSEAERRRLLGSGVRRYGFIDKVSDFAVANPEFIPPYMDEQALKDVIRQIELLRDVSANLQQLLRMTNDNLLVAGDESFRLALMYYNSVKEAANRRVPGAEAIFRILRAFFSRPRRAKDAPTEMEIERDVKALLHGKKEGEVIVKNQNPIISGGVHEVIDEVHKGHVAVKGTFEENEKM